MNYPIAHQNIIEKRYKRYKFLQLRLEKIKTDSDRKEFIQISKEMARLKKISNGYETFLGLEKEIDELNAALVKETNKELIEIYKEEIDTKLEKLKGLSSILPTYLVVEVKEYENHCYIEIQGKAGGDEANIFTGDLLEMYLRYLSKKGWKTEVISESKSEFGGFTEVLFAVMAKNAYGTLINEAGIHRVQRVPATESKGRIHTSTAKVVVSPIIEKSEIKIKKDDIEVQTFRASGAGGQHVNKTDSAVRIIHKPTGLVAVSQAGRSQHDNKESALKVIASKLREIQLKEEQNRKQKIYKAAGRGLRSEKIRTYNHPQNRVTDHRLKKSWLKLDRIMMGDLEEIIAELSVWRKQLLLEALIKEEKSE